MANYIALFRGINVGGTGLLPMQDLRDLLEGLGCADVKTYIQSGNAVFRHRAAPTSLAKKIRTAVMDAKGFEPAVLLLTLEEVQDAAAGNPFPEAEADPSKLHLFFAAADPTAPDLAALEKLRSGDERYALEGRTFYLHAPAGIGRSKLGAGAEKALGVPTTARNWRTVQKVLALAGQESD